MDRTELTIVAAAALMVALGLGWVLRWVYSLLNPPPAPPPKADSEWAEYAKACEAQRDAAQARLAEVEADLGNKLTQAQAELSAAMEGLAAARRATEHLEGRLTTLDATRTSAAVVAAEAPPEPSALPVDEPAAAENETPEPEQVPPSGDAGPLGESTVPRDAAADIASEPTAAEIGETEPDAEATEVGPAEIEADAPDAEDPAPRPDAAGTESGATEATPEDAEGSPEATGTAGPGGKRKRTRRKPAKGGTGTSGHHRGKAKTGEGA